MDQTQKESQQSLQEDRQKVQDLKVEISAYDKHLDAKQKQTHLLKEQLAKAEDEIQLINNRNTNQTN